MNLQAFMVQNQRATETVKRIISDRFKNEKGEIEAFELRGITTKEEMKIRKNCMVEVTIKKGVKVKQLDQEAFMLKMATACVVYPDLKSEELQNYFGVRGEEDTLLELLSAPGEYQELLSAMQELNGYSKDMNQLKEEAKN